MVTGTRLSGYIVKCDALSSIRKVAGSRRVSFHFFRGGGPAQKLAEKMTFSTKKVAKYRWNSLIFALMTFFFLLLFFFFFAFQFLGGAGLLGPPPWTRAWVRGSQVALKHVFHDMEIRTLVMKLRQRANKRWVPCGDMDRRLIFKDPSLSQGWVRISDNSRGMPIR